jgi:hypothetical protein
MSKEFTDKNYFFEILVVFDETYKKCYANATINGVAKHEFDNEKSLNDYISVLKSMETDMMGRFIYKVNIKNIMYSERYTNKLLINQYQYQY